MNGSPNLIQVLDWIRRADGEAQIHSLAALPSRLSRLKEQGPETRFEVADLAALLGTLQGVVDAKCGANGDSDLGRVLGAGGSGVVVQLGSRRALKIVAPPELATGDWKVDLPEARALKELSSCPLIVECYDVFDLLLRPTMYYGIVLECVDGDLLSQRIPDRRWGLAERLGWFERIAQAVFFQHNTAKLLHLDLKPDNIGWVRGGDPRLLDFGLVEYNDDTIELQAGTAWGTAGYAAPEQFPAQGRETYPLSHKADIYALGVILAELLLCERLFRTEDEDSNAAYAAWFPDGHAAAIEALDTRVRAAWPDLGEGDQARLVRALEAVRAAISPLPNDRPDTAHVLLDRLRGTGDQAPAPPPPQPHDEARVTRFLAVEKGTQHADLLYAAIVDETEISLTDVVVSLNVLEQSGESEEPASPADAEALLAERGQPRSLPFQEALDRHRCVLVDGKPGAGKTTLMRARAKTLLDAVRARPDQPEPLLVRLRDLNSAQDVPFTPKLRGRGQPHDLFHWVASWHRWELGEHRKLPAEHAFSAEQVRAGVASGELVLLLDGFDELTEENQALLAKLLADLSDAWLAEHGAARIVLTTRPSSIESEGALSQHDAIRSAFVRATVEDLDERGRLELATGLLACLPNRAGLSAEDDRAFLDRLRDKGPADYAPLRELAATPVIVTLMALVHRVDKKPLPSNRAVLYGRAIDELSDRFLDKRKLGERWKGWDQAQLAACFSHIAWEAFQRDEPHLNTRQAEGRVREWVAAWLEDSLGLEPEAARREARWRVDDLRAASGLLVEPGNPTQRFAHPTIAEYLAARALVQREPSFVVRTFRDRLTERRWREVLKLAAGLSADARFNLDGGVGRFRRLLEGVVQDAGPELVATLPPVLQEVRSLRVRDGYLEPLRERARDTLVPWVESRELPTKVRAELGDVLGYAGDPRLAEDRWVPVADDPPFEIQRWPVVVGEYVRLVGIDAGDLRDELERWSGLAPKLREDLDGWLRRTRSISEPSFWGDQLAGPPNRPATGMDWYEAMAYCLWLNRQEESGGSRVFLPTAEQWARAARGGRDAPASNSVDYPWHGTFDQERANTREGGLGRTSAVGCYPGGHTMQGEGAWDMAGNVREWSATLSGAENRVICGGSFGHGARYARCGHRNDWHPWHRNAYAGFRPARTSPPAPLTPSPPPATRNEDSP